MAPVAFSFLEMPRDVLPKCLVEGVANLLLKPPGDIFIFCVVISLGEIDDLGGVDSLFR